MVLAQPANLRIHLPLDRIADVCRHHGVRELRVFGSALNEDFRPDSDVDLLVTFHDENLGPWMEKLTRLEAELSALLRRRVDLVPADSIK